MTYEIADLIRSAIGQPTLVDEIYSDLPSAPTSRLEERRRTDRQNETMTSITREEFDAKLETIESRMDGRVARIEGKIDALLGRAEANEKVFVLLGEKAATAAESAASSAERAASSAERAGGLKSTMWLTSITTILAVLGIALAAYFGTQQSNIGMVQSTISAFEAGKTAGTTSTPAPPPAPAKK